MIPPSRAHLRRRTLAYLLMLGLLLLILIQSGGSLQYRYGNWFITDAWNISESWELPALSHGESSPLGGTPKTPDVDEPEPVPLLARKETQYSSIILICVAVGLLLYVRSRNNQSVRGRKHERSKKVLGI